VNLPGHARREPSYGGAAREGAGPGRDPYRDAQTHQVQVGPEDLLPPRATGHIAGQRLTHLGEQSQRERMPGVVALQIARAKPVPRQGRRGLPLGQVPDRHGARGAAR
jgi:hypothetical protein